MICRMRYVHFADFFADPLDSFEIPELTNQTIDEIARITRFPTCGIAFQCHHQQAGCDTRWNHFEASVSEEREALMRRRAVR